MFSGQSISSLQYDIGCRWSSGDGRPILQRGRRNTHGLRFRLRLLFRGLCGINNGSRQGFGGNEEIGRCSWCSFFLSRCGHGYWHADHWWEKSTKSSIKDGFVASRPNANPARSISAPVSLAVHDLWWLDCDQWFDSFRHSEVPTQERAKKSTA